MIREQRSSTIPAEQAPGIKPVERSCRQPGCEKYLGSNNKNGVYCAKHRHPCDRVEKRSCLEPACGKRLHSDNTTGYCWKHYHPKNRPSVERKVVCQWTDCSNRLGSNNKSGLCKKHRQRKTTTHRHLTRAEKVLVDRRIAELCAEQISGPELTARLNLEFGLNWPSVNYWQRAHLRGQPWTEGRRRVPEIPLAELPICNYCGKVRLPVPYRIGSKAGQALLCEKRCCPDCGGKLEVHSKPNGGNWVHALPLPPRNCSVCGKEFQPNNIKRPHKETCSDVCMQSASHRNWRENNPDQVRERNKQGNLRRKKKLAELERLKNVIGLKFMDGLRVSIAAHLLLKDLTEAQIKTDIYPEEVADRYDSTKKLVERRAPEIDAEKRRILKLSEDDRHAELERLHKRLRRALRLPQ